MGFLLGEDTSDCAQGFLLALCSGITPGRAHKIKPRLTAYEINTLLIALSVLVSTIVIIRDQGLKDPFQRKLKSFTSLMTSSSRY